MEGSNNLFGSGVGIVALVALVAALLAMAGMVFLLLRQRRLLRQYRQWMTGTSGTNLEVVLTDHVSRVHETADRMEALAQQVRHLEQAGRLCLQHIAMVRFNPFQDTGSDQSFSVALADADGNGIVLSSLHARGATRVYAKPLQAWESGYSLADEEKEAIARARGSDLQR
jgi:hypothetical protein